MVVVVLVGLVRGALSGVGSASALRLSIGSGADSWWTGSGALWSCVEAVWFSCAVEVDALFWHRRRVALLLSAQTSRCAFTVVTDDVLRCLEVCELCLGLCVFVLHACIF